MPKPVKISEAGGTLSPPAPSAFEHAKPDAVVAGLPNLRLEELRLQWRNHLGRTAPTHLPKWLLMRVLAYRVQTAEFGDLGKAALRELAASEGEGLVSSGSGPFAPRSATTRDGAKLNAGGLMTREWNGRVESVMVLEEGFAWNGVTFRSLSQVAKAITGTNWNGHRFFGLRAAAKRGKSPEVETARSTREEPR